MDVRFAHPSSFFIAGPSCSGKTFFVRLLLQYLQKLLTRMPQRIVWRISKLFSWISQCGIWGRFELFRKIHSRASHAYYYRRSFVWDKRQGCI